jgi:hypothetical protein
MAKKTQRRAGAHINLMLPAELHQRIAALAQHHHFTISNMIRVMVLEYLEGKISVGYERILRDMEIHWLRYANRFSRLELEEKIIDALATASSLEDVAEIRNLARASQKRRTGSEQREAKYLAGGGPETAS